MAILRILFQRGTSGRLRLMAMANVMACSFVTVMTLLTSIMSYFVIVPTIFKDSEQTVFIHRFAIGYLFVNVCGNFILCVCIDTSTTRPHRRNVRHKNFQSRVASRRTKALDKTRSKISSADNFVPGKANVSEGVATPQEIPTLPNSGISSKGPSKSQRRLNNSNAIVSQSDIQTHIKEAEKDDLIIGDSVENERVSSTSGDSSHPRVAARDTGNRSAKDENSKRGSTSQSACAPRSSGTEALKSSAAKQMARTREPERSHECKLCEKQILRRDHHCFFMTVCIGYHNHKHFIFFCLYMMLGALYGVLLNVRYLHLLYKIRFRGPQTFLLLPVQVMTNVWMKGTVPTPFFCLLLFLLYVCLFVGLTAAGFLLWHLAITVNGQTTHEASSGDMRYRRRLTHNLRDVFGRFWPLLFLLPLPLPQAGDGRSYTAAAPATDARGQELGTAAQKGNVSTKNGNYGDVDTVRGEKSGSACTQAGVASPSSSPEETSKSSVRDRRKGRVRMGK